MKLEDKSVVMAFLGLPRFGLSPSKLLAIEKVIDQPAAYMGERAWVSYKEAMAALGFTTEAGIRNLARQGHLELYRLPGRKQAVGVRKDSLESLLKERGVA